MKSHEDRKVLDVSKLWIIAGVTLSILGFLPLILVGSPQAIIMGVLGLIFIGVGIYAKWRRAKTEKTLDQ